MRSELGEPQAPTLWPWSPHPAPTLAWTEPGLFLQRPDLADLCDLELICQPPHPVGRHAVGTGQALPECPPCPLDVEDGSPGQPKKRGGPRPAQLHWCLKATMPRLPAGTTAPLQPAQGMSPRLAPQASGGPCGNSHRGCPALSSEPKQRMLLGWQTWGGEQGQKETGP